MAGRLYLGTSGFAYPEWKGTFYPAKIRDADMLSYYSRRLSSVEINYTFRRFPTERLLAGWRARVSEGFALTLKAHQRITHLLRLADVEGEVADFVRVARTLGDRLGVILFQCPPSLKYDPGLLEGFLQVVPPVVRTAMEFRHPSWDCPQARALLARHGVALALADTGQRPFLHRTAPFVYVRMRDEEMGEGDLRAWADTIRSALAEGDAYVYFKHEGAGGVQALRFSALVGLDASHWPLASLPEGSPAEEP
ncbi:MAG TPA: DUF72 domain-containing protein [Candidatus Nitrosotenuis sp.]|nr:DUF72 domain-containing protein [Candidatus Nitrosotenuis sp.]